MENNTVFNTLDGMERPLTNGEVNGYDKEAEVSCDVSNKVNLNITSSSSLMAPKSKTNNPCSPSPYHGRGKGKAFKRPCSPQPYKTKSHRTSMRLHRHFTESVQKEVNTEIVLISSSCLESSSKNNSEKDLGDNDSTASNPIVQRHEAREMHDELEYTPNQQMFHSIAETEGNMQTPLKSHKIREKRAETDNVSSKLNFPANNVNRSAPPHRYRPRKAMFDKLQEIKRTFPAESISDRNRKIRYLYGTGSTSKNLAVAELRTMVHSLFLESSASVELASCLLFIVLTVCVSHEAQFNGSKKPRGEANYSAEEIVEGLQAISESQKGRKNKKMKKQGPIAVFDSYVLAVVCALACELQLFRLVLRADYHSVSNSIQDIAKPVKIHGSSHELHNGIDSAVRHTRRILAILEALFSLKPSSVGTPWRYSSNEIIAAAMVAAHISELFKRSKACMHALSVLMHCKWDNEIHSRASSLYNLIDIHSKAVASIKTE